MRRPTDLARRGGAAADIDLADIQGNVLRGYTMPAAAYLFLRIVDVEKACALMARMLPQVATAAPWRDGAPATAMNVAFTYAGLQALELPDDVLASFPEVFRQGMAGRADKLGDRGPSAPQHWDPGLGTGDAHVLVTVYALDAEHLRAALMEILGADSDNAVELVHLQRAESLAGGRDHFGFFDGIAQPALIGSGVTPRPGDGQPDGRGGWRGLATGEVLLGYRDEDGTLPVAPVAPFERNGTYVVYRKLAMHVGAFRSYIAAEGERYPGGARKLAAKIVGRWPDGTPLVLSPDRPDASISSDTERINDFGYADDREGLRCPIGSHIRRSNPRDAEGFFDGRLTDRHRIVRRGRPYGMPLPRRRPRGRRRRPRPRLRLLPGQHLAPVRDHPIALDRRRRPLRPRPRQGLPGRRAARRPGQDDDPGQPAVLPQTATALRHHARRRVPLPAVDDRAAPPLRWRVATLTAPSTSRCRPSCRSARR